MNIEEQQTEVVTVSAAEIISALVEEIDAQRGMIRALLDVQKAQGAALQRHGEAIAMIEGRLAGVKRGIA